MDHKGGRRSKEPIMICHTHTYIYIDLNLNLVMLCGEIERK